MSGFGYPTSPPTVSPIITDLPPAVRTRSSTSGSLQSQSRSPDPNAATRMDRQGSTSSQGPAASLTGSQGGKGKGKMDLAEALAREEDEEQEEPVKFVLLAEFDIDQGATLAAQYPFPTGTDEHILAELMLPDGAHLRAEDWTIFYLNQTPKNAVAPVLAHESPGRRLAQERFSPLTATEGFGDGMEGILDKAGKEGGKGDGKSKVDEMLFVLNCVRCKEDASVRRGALVKALAVCTSKPYIQIYKPLLLLALEEYFQNPSPAVLAKLFDSLNSIPMKGCPSLSRSEMLILRNSEQKDLFEEKFGQATSLQGSLAGHGSAEGDEETLGGDGSGEPDTGEGAKEATDNGSSQGHGSASAAKMRFSGLGSGSHPGTSNRLKKSSRTSLKDDAARGSPVGQSAQMKGLGIGRPLPTRSPSNDSPHRPASSLGRTGSQGGVVKDTHFFDTQAVWNGMAIPIRIPLTTFHEEVGDYSLIQLVQAFTPSTPHVFPAPFHPQLHTSGANTHPVILLLNALLTQKRVLFLGHGRPAGHVANFVLAACSLTGQVLRGFTERAFPYSNLAGLEMLEETPGYIAGVTNPRFEDLHSVWDVLCNLETGKITISKELGKDPMSMQSLNHSLTSLTSVARTDIDDGHGLSQPMSAKEGRELGKGETSDSLFMEDIMMAIQSHYGESMIRARFADYVTRFIRLAARFEQDTVGSTKIDFPSKPFQEGNLGSGMTFSEDSLRAKEMALNGPRIDGWRRSRSYGYWKDDFQTSLVERAIRGFDLKHQIARLRSAKNMPEWEALQIYRVLSGSVETYDQVLELLSNLPAHAGGLMPIALGLFHRSDLVRNAVIEILDSMQRYPIGHTLLASLNAFQRMAYIRLSEEKAEKEGEMKGLGHATPGQDMPFGIRRASEASMA